MNSPHDLCSATNARGKASCRSTVNRRHLLRLTLGTTAATAMAACGNQAILERVVVIPKIVERTIFSERPSFVTHTVLSTTSQTESASANQLSTTESAPTVPRVQLRLAIGPAFGNDLYSSIESINHAGDFVLERIDASTAGQDRLLTRIATGKGPDVLGGVHGSLLARLAASGDLSPLNRSTLLSKGFVPDFLPLGTHDDQILGIPMLAYPVHLLTNPRRLQDSGLQSPGSTYADLEESAKRMTDPTQYLYGFGVVADIPELETVMRAAGTFGTTSSVTAWQWYINQWQLHRTSPAPTAWDGVANPVEAITAGKISMALVHGRALRTRAGLSAKIRSACDAAPLVSWATTKPQNPMYATYVATNVLADPIARDVAIALASPTKPIPYKGMPSWEPAFDSAAKHAGLPPELLDRDKVTWTRPLTDTADSKIRTSVLAAAVRSTLIEEIPADVANENVRTTSTKQGIDNWVI